MVERLLVVVLGVMEDLVAVALADIQALAVRAGAVVLLLLDIWVQTVLLVLAAQVAAAQAVVRHHHIVVMVLARQAEELGF